MILRRYCNIFILIKMHLLHSLSNKPSLIFEKEYLNTTRIAEISNAPTTQVYCGTPKSNITPSEINHISDVSGDVERDLYSKIIKSFYLPTSAQSLKDSRCCL